MARVAAAAVLAGAAAPACTALTEETFGSGFGAPPELPGAPPRIEVTAVDMPLEEMVYFSPPPAHASVSAVGSSPTAAAAPAADPAGPPTDAAQASTPPSQGATVAAAPAQTATALAQAAQASPVSAETVQAETVQAETVQAETVQAETVQAEAVQEAAAAEAAQATAAAPSAETAGSSETTQATASAEATQAAAPVETAQTAALAPADAAPSTAAVAAADRARPTETTTALAAVAATAPAATAVVLAEDSDAPSAEDTRIAADAVAAFNEVCVRSLGDPNTVVSQLFSLGFKPSPTNGMRYSKGGLIAGLRFRDFTGPRTCYVGAPLDSADQLTMMLDEALSSASVPAERDAAGVARWEFALDEATGKAAVEIDPRPSIQSTRHAALRLYFRPAPKSEEE